MSRESEKLYGGVTRIDDETGVGTPNQLAVTNPYVVGQLSRLAEAVPDEADLRARVRDIPQHPEYVAELRSYVCGHGGIEYAMRRLDDFIGEALEALEAFPASPERDALAEIARYNAIRKV